MIEIRFSAAGDLDALLDVAAYSALVK
jgi:hypothetical protein